MSDKPQFTLDSVQRFKLATVRAGIKASGQVDLGLIVCDGSATAAGVFTKNAVVSPAVTVSRSHLKSTRGKARAILVNAGNANACTGEQGQADAETCAEAVAGLIGCSPKEVLLCSTGIIGHPLPMDKMQRGIGVAAGELGSGSGDAFARAIMTTDTVPKSASCKPRGLGGAVIAGVCKGSGMIAPKMATMLAFVLTDAAISPKMLRTALSEVVDETFNRVTVDGDCSTNDTVLILASGAKGGEVIAETTDKRYSIFRRALGEVCLSLATQIAQDGEGATKLVRVNVTGAKSLADAKKAARTVSESPLVKTAMFGNDPNWGRILCAVGRSGCTVKEEKVMISLCGVTLFKEGAPTVFDAAKLSKQMESKDIAIDIHLGLGNADATMLTCDFSYDYVRINAEYHT